MNKKIKILFVCHGNICRSTMAQSVFQDMVNKAGLADRFEIDSAATSTEEIGNPPHHGTTAELRSHGVPVIPHRARQLTKADAKHFDYLIGMDTANIRNMCRMTGADDKIYKLLAFADIGSDVADPWYTGDFAATYADVSLGCKMLLEKLKEELFDE